MAVGDGWTEARDSDDEPVASKRDNKLSATGPVPLQDRQDALPEAKCSHQACAQDVANAAPDSAETLGVDQCNASVNVGELSADPSELHGRPSRQEGHADEAAAFAPLPQTRHDPGLASQMLSAASAGSDPGNLASEPGPVTHRVADVVHSSPSPRPAEQVGDPRVSENRTSDEPFSEEVPSKVYKETVADRIDALSTANLLPVTDDESDHTTNNLHRKLAMEESPQDVDTEEQASSGVAKEMDNNCNGVSAETNMQMSNAAEIACETMDSMRTGSMESVSTVNTESRPRRDAPEDTVQPQNNMEASNTSTQSHGTEPCLKTCDRYLEGQDLSTSIQEPPIPETTTMSPFEQRSREEQIRAEEAVNDPHAEHSNMGSRSEDESKNASSPASTVSTSQLLLTSLEPAEGSITRPSPPKTPQEVTLAELKTQKTALLASLGTQPAIQVLIEESESPGAEADDGNDGPTEADIMAAANKIVREHIKLLHEYNELKDVGQGLMGLIADQRGVRIVEVQDEFGIEAKD